MPLKICVYAISKDEAKFVSRWAKSAQDADLILLADTGSSDATVEIAKNCGVKVHDICISPWRFDHARNASLALIPRDIDVCVCVDVDEVLEPGWRQEIEDKWTEHTTRLRYQYDWGHGKQFQYDKIHSRFGYAWCCPAHEVLRADGRITERFAYTSKLLVSHHPDATKSRGQYLDLLRLSVEEDPNCPRSAWYYARELYYHFRWDEAAQAILRYLDMPGANWVSERCYALRTLSECLVKKDDITGAEVILLQAVSEGPLIRENWVALAELMYSQNRWEECFAYANRALRITIRLNDYTVDPNSWKDKPYDLAAISAYRLGLKDVAIKHGRDACILSPEDKRLSENLQWYLGNR